MNIIKPNGELYMRVYTKGEMVYLSPSRYDFQYSMTFDRKIIPQLVAALKDIQENDQL